MSDVDFVFKLAVIGTQNDTISKLLTQECGPCASVGENSMYSCVTLRDKVYCPRNRAFRVKLMHVPGDLRFLELSTRLCASVAGLIIVCCDDDDVGFCQTVVTQLKGSRNHTATVLVIDNANPNALAPASRVQLQKWSSLDRMPVFEINSRCGGSLHDAISQMVETIDTMVISNNTSAIDGAFLAAQNIKMGTRLLRSSQFQNSLFAS